MCADKVNKARDLAIISQMNGGVPGRRSSFDEALTTLKQAAGPATTQIAEALMEKLGGPTTLGHMIADDIRKVRGDDLPEDIRCLHTVDTKSLTRLYDIVLRMAAKRDDLVQGVADPLDGMSEEDLMALTAETALLRVELDPEFRMRLLKKIKEVAPEDLETLWMIDVGLTPSPGVVVQ